MHMHNIIHFDELNSTNVYAHQHLAELNDFDVISCNLQNKGHGQYERSWFSSDKNGGNIYISIVLKPDNISHIDEFTRYIALMASRTLEKYGLKPTFKYPNDILIDGKKIAGFLAESEFIGQKLKGIVMGAGINLNLTQEEIKNIDIAATSIFLETGKNIDKDEFLNRFLDEFENSYKEFLVNGLKNIGEVKC